MVELETLLTSIASSVQMSQAAIQQNAYQNFLEYFVDTAAKNSLEDAEHEKKTMHVPIIHHFNISEESESEGIAVPSVALVNHNSLVLDNVKVVLNVSGVPDGNHFMVSTEPMNDEHGMEHHQITLEFKQKEPSEGIARMLTEYNHFL